ncbi:MAG: M14 family zinc carboxypeptidase [Ignavibacteria bacterium]|nr:M14 family zinc carboxypeptidase [Ignavibacteria bacterium]
MKKFFLFLFLTSIFTFTSPAQEIYKQIKVFVPDQLTFQSLTSSGVDLEGMTGKIGDWFELIVSEKELDLLKRLGFTTITIIEDYSKFLEDRLYKGAFNALGFGYGSMGGYYTYTEVIQQLDSMKILYPDLITTKLVVGSTIEGRNIFAVKISDNPNLNEVNEPAVLFTALTHAREPGGMMTIIYYMWWLLQNYGTDPLATYLVNNRQIYFIPVVNPDGYVYNQTTNPYGGGMWRKNRRYNVDGSYGVDLNRNFGPYAYWDGPSGGSSTTPSSNTYRGTAPFSEPETQTIKNFLAGKNIRACLNYHTYSNLLIYPYGALMRETPDSLVYRDYAKDMTKFNGYIYGTDQQTVFYSTRGNSDDYMYDGDIPNNGKIFAMTPEVGSVSDGFWPPSSRILPLALENLYPNIFITAAVGAFPKFQLANIYDSTGDNFLDRGEKFVLNLTLRNKGLDSAKNVSISLNSNNQDLIFSSDEIQVGDFAPLSDKNVNIECRVNKRATTGVIADVFLNTKNGDGLQILDTLQIVIGKQSLAFSDSASDTTMQNWSSNGWGITTIAQSPPYSFTDSPLGTYNDNTDSKLTLLNNLNLSFATSIKLKFSAMWDIEPRYDFATVEVSSNGGISWTSVKGKYTKAGSGYGVQTVGTYGYDGKQNSWIEEEMDLTKFASSQFKFRFRLRSDSYARADGIFIDNIRLIYSRVDSAKFSDMAFNPQVINFGDVQIFEKSESQLILENLSTSNDSLRGNLKLKFGTDYKINGSKIFSIPIGAQKIIPLSFRPNSLGRLEDTLIVYHSSDAFPNPILIPLSGTGINNYNYRFRSDLVVINGSNKDTLIFGAEYGATDTLDSLFNETELDVVPPLGTFDVRWMIENTNGTKIDIRDTISIENLSNIYKLRYQLEDGYDTLIIKWDKNKFSAGSFVLKDSLTNGASILLNLKDNDSIVIIGYESNPLLIVHKFIPTTKIKVNEGWNLVSIPTIMENYSKYFIFPGSSSAVYGFNSNEYIIVDTLSPGNGYWLKFGFPREYLFSGFPILIDTLTLNPGWNLVGTIGENVMTENIEILPGGNLTSLIYGYESGYIIEDTLKPGRGYWLKVQDSSKVVLNAYRKNSFNKITKFNEFEIGILNFSNSERSQKIYFTKSQIDNLDLFEMPPLPPSNIFDVRFSSNRILESIDGLKKKMVELKIQSEKFPISVSWNNVKSNDFSWVLVIDKGSENFEYKLDISGKAYINESTDRVFLKAEKSYKEIALPSEFVLEQNYPNPFNSRTKIKYSIPKAAKVTIKLFDVIGKEIGVFVDGFLDPGYYEYEFDADNLSSGVYYYQLRSGNFNQVKKLVIIK